MYKKTGAGECPAPEFTSYMLFYFLKLCATATAHATVQVANRHGRFAYRVQAKPELAFGCSSIHKIIAFLFLEALCHSYCACDSAADHGVVAHAHEAHHFDVCRNR